MGAEGRRRVVTWSLKPRSANFLKSCRDAASATTLSFVDTQCALISISKRAEMSRMVRRGRIAGPRIDRLLMPPTTAELSHATSTEPFAHSLCQMISACRMANISFQLMCLSLCREGTLDEKIRPSYTPPMPLRPLASVLTWKIVRDS
jgi:hypothetical protein